MEVGITRGAEAPNVQVHQWREDSGELGHVHPRSPVDLGRELFAQNVYSHTVSLDHMHRSPQGYGEHHAQVTWVARYLSGNLCKVCGDTMVRCRKWVTIAMKAGRGDGAFPPSGYDSNGK
ncbi:hypothetical protein GCM10025781_20680 [Kocuria gwangalliensis]|uniref:Uncharacterized protein n=1 Tax=Kocuria gwangalliensis TaxID=501592 RepID=A0ABP8X923_9MICC